MKAEIHFDSRRCECRLARGTREACNHTLFQFLGMGLLD